MTRTQTLALATALVCCDSRSEDPASSQTPSSADVNSDATDVDAWEGSTGDDAENEVGEDVGLRDSDSDVDAEETGCQNFWGRGLPRDGFQEAPPWSSATLADIVSPREPVFWEVRVYQWEMGSSEVIASTGPPCGDEETDACADEYAAVVEASHGFECHWLIGPQSVNIVVRTVDGFSSFESPEELLQFFGQVDTPFEARLWMRTHCEFVGPSRPVESGFEFIVHTIEEVCNPVVAGEANRFVDTDGRIRWGGESVVTSVECDSCI